ncbi:transglycosylase SLT domain-containing protein [Streptomyces cavernae]|uniref:transglycosylase SLT domain-containing protein n=1 Tax=Streptomyces cavernae TaxID=2259034 RepID=UPI000FEBFBFC|nr:transglycosylase SLT domain-containing protein [Streptomyces cavernae]
MPLHNDIFRRIRPNITVKRNLTTKHKQRLGIAGVAALGAASLTFSLMPSDAQTTTDETAVSAAAFSDRPVKEVRAGVTDQLAGAELKARAAEAKQQSAEAKEKADAKEKAEAAAKKEAAEKAAAKKRAAQKKAEEERKKKAAASRAAARPAMKQVAAKTYPNNLDGWIRESLDVMKKNGIPGSYHGLHKNIMRESSGNPKAINNWDINAINGVPSKGLLQVIPPTFQAYHVPGTSWDIYDPVANITAAANYAADRYGSIDNVNGPY